jgi:hypothetical protein
MTGGCSARKGKGSKQMVGGSCHDDALWRVQPTGQRAATREGRRGSCLTRNMQGPSRYTSVVPYLRIRMCRKLTRKLHLGGAVRG